MRPELILWDWNGTLLDDVELCVDALNRLLAEARLSAAVRPRSVPGDFWLPESKNITSALGLISAATALPMLAEEYMDDYIPASAACPLAEGAIEALDAFRAAGLRQVMLSASPVPTLTRQAEERHVTRLL